MHKQENIRYNCEICGKESEMPREFYYGDCGPLVCSNACLRKADGLNED